MFEELADYRAFELLRSHSARSDYLLTKQARIIAMTCTHAALIRRKLVELGFKYDNMVMEESAQILEVETFIPMMLQVGHCIYIYGCLRLQPPPESRYVKYFVCCGLWEGRCVWYALCVFFRCRLRCVCSDGVLL